MRIIEKEKIILIGCMDNQHVSAIWDKWERMTETIEIKHGIVDSAGHSAGHEVRFETSDGEYIFVGVEVSRTEPDSEWEYLSVPAALYAVFEIDQKIDQNPQFAGVNKWLEENAGKYKRVVWDADGKISPSEFVICQYDHRIEGKYHKDRIMEMWIPIEKT